MTIIKAENLGKIFPNGKVGLEQVNIEIKKGEMVGILGPSGAGKTTFFRLLNGAIAPTQGNLEVLEHSLRRISHKKLLKLRKRMAFVYQHHNIVPGLSVARNVFLGCLPKLSLPGVLRSLFYIKTSEMKKVYDVLNRLGIGDKIFQRATDLSGGQQQRVALARALISTPEVILADEPIASVDAKTAEQILDIFLELNQQKQVTVIMNLHQVDIALRYCSRVLVFNKGRLVFDGPPSKVPAEFIYNKPAQKRSAVCG